MFYIWQWPLIGRNIVSVYIFFVLFLYFAVKSTCSFETWIWTMYFLLKMPCKFQWKPSKIVVKLDWSHSKVVVKFEPNPVEILRNSYSGCCSSKSNIIVCWNLTLCCRILCFPRFSDRHIFVNVRGFLSCFRLVSTGSFSMYFDPESVRKESDENLVRSDRCSPEEIDSGAIRYRIQ